MDKENVHFDFSLSSEIFTISVMNTGNDSSHIVRIMTLEPIEIIDILIPY